MQGKHHYQYKVIAQKSNTYLRMRNWRVVAGKRSVHASRSLCLFEESHVGVSTLLQRAAAKLAVSREGLLAQPRKRTVYFRRLPEHGLFNAAE